MPIERLIDANKRELMPVERLTDADERQSMPVERQTDAERKTVRRRVKDCSHVHTNATKDRSHVENKTIERQIGVMTNDCSHVYMYQSKRRTTDRGIQSHEGDRTRIECASRGWLTMMWCTLDHVNDLYENNTHSCQSTIIAHAFLIFTHEVLKVLMQATWIWTRREWEPIMTIDDEHKNEKRKKNVSNNTSFNSAHRILSYRLSYLFLSITHLRYIHRNSKSTRWWRRVDEVSWVTQLRWSRENDTVR